MALSLDFELRLEDRKPDRVLVSVLLAPHSSLRIDGVSLQIISREGEPVSARMVLPIAGELSQPMLSTMELRAIAAEIPQGSRVVGTAWAGHEQRDAALPTDPSTEFERHVRARCRVVPDVLEDDVRLIERLTPEERATVARAYPWVDEPRLPVAVGELEVVDHEQTDEEVFDHFCDELGLDGDSAEWLKDLLSEET